MTYEYKPGEVPVPARTCVRCGTGLEAEASPGGRTAGWFHPSALSGATIWVFTSRGAPPTAAAERLRCPTCDRRYALVRA
jgi:hypothetical protein